MFYINTRYNSIEYNYIMRKGSEGPEIDLLNEEFTTERNGTEIKVYINDETDLYKFLKESFEQLHYFKNVVFDLEGIKNIYHSSAYLSHIGRYVYNSINTLEEDYNLVEGKTFIYRTNTRSNELHLSIGNVNYPIDWSNLGVSRISLPLALKFDIGELQVIQTREDIRYTDDNIAKIKQRLNEFTDEIVELYNKHSVECEDIHKFIKQVNNQFTIILKDKEINIDIFVRQYSLESRLNPIQINNFPYQFKSYKENMNFKAALTGDLNISQPININPSHTFKTNGNLHKIKTNYVNIEIKDRVGYRIGFTYNNHYSIENINLAVDRLYDIDHTYKPVYYNPSKKFSVKKNKYLQNVIHKEVDPDDFIFVDKINLYFGYNFYKEVIKFIDNALPNITKDERKSIIKFVMPDYTNIKKGFLDYDSVKVDEVWWKKYQEENRKTVDYDRTALAIDKLDSIYSSSISYDRKSYRPNLGEYIKSHKFRILIPKSDKETYTSTAHDYNYTGFEKLIKAFSVGHARKIFPNVFDINIISDRNYKKVNENKLESSNIFTIDEFKNNKIMQTRYLGKLATILKIKEAIDNSGMYSDIFNSTMHNIVKMLFEGREYLEDYEEIYNLYNSKTDINTTYLKEFLADCDDLNDIEEIYHQDILDKFEKVFKLFKDTKLNYFNDLTSSVFGFVCNYKRPSENYYRLAKYLEKNYTLEELYTLTGVDATQDDAEKQLNNYSVTNIGRYSAEQTIKLTYIVQLNLEKLNK